GRSGRAFFLHAGRPATRYYSPIAMPGPPMLERELKLHVPAANRNALENELRHAGAADLALRARYFDTPGRNLARAGIALRLRLEGDEWVQTAKTSGPDELTRMEFNHPRPGPEL